MAANDTEDRRTRQKVFQSVLDEGPITASSLAKALELTPAAIRRHLDALESEGLLEVRELAGKQAGRGRPARHYVVTTAGHDSVSHSYDELAVNILRFMEDKHGRSAVEGFTEDLVNRLRERLGPELEKRGGTTVASRSRALAAALTREGYAASATPVAAGTPLEAMQLCQGHCPIQAVATEYPEICEAELAMFSDYLGVDVRRLSSLAQGDHVCTTHIPTSELTRPLIHSNDRPQGGSR
ncbi:ArsR family transcriptional regulator [Brevibacterium permense]|uniref:helix-turn-helix transcriptional regulator n=1 Tax=Brevibacterium permense TaxID=234834 RepID=UPI0021D31858|nr:helix-turn-helix domain-containing protein [Brevibacterium permense]MCU4297894.1 ArsR family transcriptional regulator [Brevibacterium permense]